MKQTAVQWLAEQITTVKWKMSDVTDRNSIIEQAKAMEKEQLIMFGAQCMVEVEKESGLGAIQIYELYFDKTYKSE